MFDPKLIPPVHLARLPPSVWPDPRRLPAEGLGGFGGELTPERILAAYEHGYFPCYDETTVPLWWSPDPRAVFVPGSFHASASLGREARRRPFRVTWNRAFPRVIRECGQGRTGGRWILPEIIEVYSQLAASGRAFSLEVWLDDPPDVAHDAVLVGGVYGVQRGALFCAESMFHRVTGASKIALAWLLENLFANGIESVDAQYPTPHLRSLGAQTVARSQYVATLPGLTTRNVDLTKMLLKAPACFAR